MAPLIHCSHLSKSFGSRTLFRNLSISIFTKEKIGLIGPNGTGKSTLVKIFCGIESADSGELAITKGLKIGYLPQECMFDKVHPAKILMAALSSNTTLEEYEKETQVATWLSKLRFQNSMTCAAQLSGGWKKKLGLARELIQKPDLLLLDEPTNHLDLEAIAWLDQFLKAEATTYLLVSHDRYFLQKATNKIIEIDPAYPDGSFSIQGSYDHFLQHKQLFLEGQLERQRSLASQASYELDWLRRSPKARTCKSKSRVEETYKLLEELSNVKKRNQKKQARLDFTASERETRKLLVAKNLSKHLGSHLLFHHLDLTLSPGSRIGLVGPNGSGKTTLLRLLQGDLIPDTGTIKCADLLQVVYFDQHKMALPPTLTLREALSPCGDYVTYHGESIHVNGWCQRFLFSPDLLGMPISKLSGGERARIAIAHLMLKQADLLLLDEPTNDLDITTIEILEESLLEFPGAVVLITHDRLMLERVCNQFLALGDLDNTTLYPTYSQWEASRKSTLAPIQEKKEKPSRPVTPKLTFAEKQEYAEIEKKISQCEQEIHQLTHVLQTQEIADNPRQLQEICTQIAHHEAHIEELYLRFLQLDAKMTSGEK